MDGGENIPAKILQLRLKFASQTYPSTCILTTFIAEIQFVKWSILKATYQQTVEKSPRSTIQRHSSSDAKKWMESTTHTSEDLPSAAYWKRYVGLLPIVERYMDAINTESDVKEKTRCHLALIRERANGKRWTPFGRMRDLSILVLNTHW
jgi:hypothetical protein